MSHKRNGLFKMKHHLFNMWLLLSIAIIHAAVVYAQPLVEVEQGPLMGKTVLFSEHEYINVDKELDVYEGVPFAEPPVRFAHPVKREPWDGTWNGTYVRPTCYQDSLYTVKDGLEVSEDCLYLNIYVPHGITDAAVMVWIYGGGFNSGSAQQSEYNGEPLTSVGDVIYVTINYRVNTFGYLTTGDDNLPGNYGMMDQVEALRWVQQNIHAFGGNKDRVTIFGESAGSASVSYQILSKQSRDLFNQAIMQSGAAVSTWAFQETSTGKDIAFRMGEHLGCTAADDTYALRQCLRDATAKEIMDAGLEAGFLSAPCIDNYFLDDYPRNLIEKKDFKRVKLMLGSNADEGTLMVSNLYPEYLVREDPPFISKEVFEEYMSWNLQNPVLEDLVNHEYYDWSIQDQENLDYLRPFIDANTDEPFACPTDFVARAHYMVGDSVYLYQMTHKPTVSIFSIPRVNPTWLGAGHAEDMSFVFGFPFMKVNNRQELSGPEKELSVQFMKFWTTFAKTGSPSMSTDPNDEMYWPLFTIPELEHKVLALNLTTDRALKANVCNFWNDNIPKMRTFTSDLAEAEREWRMEFYSWKYEAMEEWWDAFNKYQDASGTTGCDAAGGCT